MIHNSPDIRIYSQPPPVGVAPVKHDRKWRRIFSIDVVGGPCSIMTSPKHFGEKQIISTAGLNSKYNYKRNREFLFKGNV